jgi:hypothetical protein
MVPLKTVNRQCSSGLQTVADVASAIKAELYDIGMLDWKLILTIFCPDFIGDLILFSPFKRYFCRPRVHDSDPSHWASESQGKLNGWSMQQDS